MTKQKNLIAWLFVLPALIVFTGLVMAPILSSFSLSLVRWNGLGSQVFVGLSNYLHMFQDAVFIQSFWNTVTFSVLGSSAQLLLGLAMAVSLLSVRRFRNLTRSAYFIPATISSVAISHIFAQLLALHPEGLVNGLLGAFGLEGLRGAFLSDTGLTLVIVTLVDAYKFCAIYMAIYYAALISIDTEILNAAEIDGANWWQQLRLVRLPLIRGTMAVTIILVVSGTLKGFDISFILTNGGPGASSELVSTYLYKVLFNQSNFGYGSAIAVFMTFGYLLIVGAIRWALRSESDAT
jgi:raffinose/stachyose/melibiose transport system permease protein